MFWSLEYQRRDRVMNRLKFVSTKPILSHSMWVDAIEWVPLLSEGFAAGATRHRPNPAVAQQGE
jgi:hypothetical protein